MWSLIMALESQTLLEYKHPRAGYKIVTGSWWNTEYGAWTDLPFNYGPTERDIKRRVLHNLCTDGNRFRDHEKGGSKEVCHLS